MRLAIYIFLGPTLTRARAEELVPGSIIEPPVAHGDLLRLRVSAGDVVIIIDGYYHHSAPVRHKEILALLARGVSVIGCASMGALRAAELKSYGMIGHGVVFDMYSRGVIDADDEVAVAHTTGPHFRQLSEPLVNIRYAVEQAVRANAVDWRAAGRILLAAKSLHYTERTWHAIESAIHRTEPGHARSFESVQGYLADNPWSGNVKQADAIDTLTRLAEIRARVRPSVDWNSTHDWRSRHLRDWEVRFPRGSPDGASNSDILRYQQLYNASFPRTWRHLVLDAVRRSQPDAFGTSRDDSLPAAALAAAAAWGLAPGRLSPERIEHWTTNDERAQQTPAELLLLALIRSYRHPSLLHDMSTAVPGLLTDESAHQAVLESYFINDEVASEVNHSVHQIRRQHLITHLRGTWKISKQDAKDLQVAAWDRGFESVDEAADAARPFFLRHHIESRAAEPETKDQPQTQNRGAREHAS